MSNPYDTGDDKRTSILGPTLSFKGELIAEEDLLIQGKIEGSIKHTSSLTIGNEGNVKADIKAEYITVEGKVKGDISGSKSVVVQDSGNVNGNIFSPTVSLVEGSTFNGSIDMTGKDQAEQQRPEPAAKVEDAKTKEADEIPLEPAKKATGSGKKSASAA
jgi:cytoskeletal protein CcmA (bactofilin family)